MEAINWLEGPPQIEWVENKPEKYNSFFDGSVFLVAVQVSNKRQEPEWQFDIVQIECDVGRLNLKYREGDIYDAWSWDDFDYFKLLEGEMPYFDEENS